MTNIQWTDVSWNPVTGCTKISPGCKNCYAERFANRLRGRCGYPADDPFRVTLHEDRLEQPLHWKKPRRIFVCSMSDLFHDNVPFPFIHRVFETIHNCPQHTFQILTKRSDRMLKVMDNIWFQFDRRIFNDKVKKWGMALWSNDRDIPFPNIWFGISAEDQGELNYRSNDLVHLKAARKFISLEPLLEELSVDWLVKWKEIDLVIVGCESGPGRREMKLEWFDAIQNECRLAGVPCILKQAVVEGKMQHADQISLDAWNWITE